ncbi:MAG: hypothetical protein FJ265_14600 [Planctomycetes bacterium]|nr:hypothetical protein [Planctomycetota bacterium]
MTDRNATRPTRDEVYDLLMNARQADWVELSLEDGRSLSGAIIFNEFKGTGRLINVDEEFSFDFNVDQVVDVKRGSRSRQSRGTRCAGPTSLPRCRLVAFSGPSRRRAGARRRATREEIGAPGDRRHGRTAPWENGADRKAPPALAEPAAQKLQSLSGFAARGAA